MSYTARELEAHVRGRVGALLPNGQRIGSLLGVGGMAAVYTLQSPEDTPLAIKVLHPHLTEEPMVRERFRREAYAGKVVVHPGVVPVRSDGLLSSGEPYLVMDRVLGETLETTLARPPGAIDTFEALRIAAGVLEVLHVAHSAGVLHRDIKPANLMLAKGGAVRVLDFGLARVGTGDDWGGVDTGVGVLLGTAAYISPEQAAGHRDAIGPATDIFAVGAVAFRAISGQLLHPGRNLAERMQHARHKGTRSLADVAPFTRPAVVELIDRATRANPAERYATALEFAMEIAALTAPKVSKQSP